MWALFDKVKASFISLIPIDPRRSVIYLVNLVKSNEPDRLLEIRAIMSIEYVQYSSKLPVLHAIKI